MSFNRGLSGAGQGHLRRGGIGGYYSDGKFKEDPFFAFRAGLDLEVLPVLSVDINVNYRFEKWDDLSAEGKEIDTDTITLGAAARLMF